jgi:hypothetical protein
MLYDLIDLSHMYVLIFITCPFRPIYVLLLAYTSNLSIIEFLEFPNLFLSIMTRHVCPLLPDISGLRHWKLLSLKSLDMSSPWLRHIRLIEHIRFPSRTYLALELTGIKGGVHTPSNPSLLFLLHFNSLRLQAPPW